jgi:catechol 2,3-dioxygenase-like lactoylglutathione lyase family enzyme
MIESISAVTLATHDMPRAVRFYRALGFAAQGDEMERAVSILFHGT